MNVPRIQRRLSPVLGPASKAYGIVMRLRAKRYASRLGRPYRAKCPVVSIGNIGWGGSGKTPLTDWFLAWADRNGLLSVVLTRGYGGKPPALPFSVGLDNFAGESGDEPLYLARRHPGALVLVDPKRARAAAWAEKNASPGLFILDDGMQHMAVARDMECVLLRPEDLLDEWNKVIPAGSWREPAEALGRADAFFLKADPARAAALAYAAKQRLEAFGKPLFFFHLAPTGLRRLEGKVKNLAQATRSLAAEAGGGRFAPNLDGAEYVLTCAVGAPVQVRESAVALLGRAPSAEVFFPDHHSFTEADALSLAAHGLPVVCTGKDAVKLLPLLRHFGQIPVWEMDARVVFGLSLFEERSFPEWWDATWRGLAARKGTRA